MKKKFIVYLKIPNKKEDKSLIITIRLDRELQEESGKPAALSNHFHNELMYMAPGYR